MLEKYRKKIKIASHLICFGLSLNLFYIFIMAYVNDYQIMVTVNDYGEAHVELILLPITLLFCFIGLVMSWRDKKT